MQTTTDLNDVAESSSAKPKATVVIVDDDLAIMQCVGDWLQKHEQVTVLGYAGHALAGIAMALEMQPDVVLLDIRMPGADAFWACRQIVDRNQDRSRVLFYTAFPRDQYLDRAIAAGASGMVCKHSETIQNLALAVRYVIQGNSYFSPELANRLVELEQGAPQSRLTTLTHREIEVLRQLATGHTNKEIASNLDLSLRSIEKEVYDMKRKLGLESTNELLIFAANEGLIFPEVHHAIS